MGSARQYAATIYAWCHQPQTVLEQAEAELALATKHGFPLWQAGGRISRGKALIELGQHDDGLTQLQEGIAALRAMGSCVDRPMFLGWLVDVSAQTGNTTDAQSHLIEALMLAHTTGERSYEAELYRLKGDLLQIADDGLRGAECSPEECFRKALDVARQQGAKSWELRAATSLARLWQQQGKYQEAHDLLAPVYNWFSEGFDTADLQDARVLLQELEA